MTETLQLINILMTGGVLFALLGAAIAYGKLMQKVEDNTKNIDKLWKKSGEIEKHIWGER